MKRKVVYFARFDEYHFPGISKKIRGVLSAFERNGYETECLILPDGLKNVPVSILKIMQLRACVLVVRNTFSLPLFLVFLLIARMRGCHLVLDIPTPIGAVINEFKDRKDLGHINLLLRKIYVKLIYPMGLIPFHRIIQYAAETVFLVSLFSYKTKILSNGFDVQSCPLRDRPLKPIEKTLTLLGVAKVSSWHGFDRIIEGMGDFKKNYPGEVLIRFLIIGDGEAIDSLKKLTVDVGVSDHVDFLGFRDSDAMDEFFSVADLGVSSLGLYRKGLDSASSLKSREYTARGLPFIASGADPDFEPLPEFVFKVENNNLSINFFEVLNWYHKMVEKNTNNKDIRSYAINRLDFDQKIMQLLVD